MGDRASEKQRLMGFWLGYPLHRRMGTTGGGRDTGVMASVNKEQSPTVLTIGVLSCGETVVPLRDDVDIAIIMAWEVQK